ncbi:hypothetical protein C0992_012118, partial [Termitomyces sp. T32_za158]
MATALAALLPKPRHVPLAVDDDEVDALAQQVVTALPRRPPYGQRKGWKPSTPEDFGDGGAFPECHVAQYPLDLGRKK